MKTISKRDITSIHTPESTSHKGQNGRLLLIGGSALFHAASLWSLTVASRLVDLVHFSSVEENNELVKLAKREFRNGIVIPRRDIESYIQEDDSILIGPGMTRDSDTQELTNRLLRAYPRKQWVIDAGALQMLDVDLIPHGAILTPHKGEFDLLYERANISYANIQQSGDEGKVAAFADKYHCIVLRKGPVDIASDGKDIYKIEGGNAGMTKGGTGDVLAGLIAALSCTNTPMLSVYAGSYINKYAGDMLYETMGPFFNASDLASQIPIAMKILLFDTRRIIARMP